MARLGAKTCAIPTRASIIIASRRRDDDLLFIPAAFYHRAAFFADASVEGYYGESESASPPYEIQEALSSPAGLAIAGLRGFRRPGLKRIRRLREKSTLRCSRTMDYTNCTTRCLFDLTLDPCETRDLSAQHPEVSRGDRE